MAFGVLPRLARLGAHACLVTAVLVVRVRDVALALRAIVRGFEARWRPSEVRVRGSTLAAHSREARSVPHVPLRVRRRAPLAPRSIVARPARARSHERRALTARLRALPGRLQALRRRAAISIRAPQAPPL